MQLAETIRILDAKKPSVELPPQGVVVMVRVEGVLGVGMYHKGDWYCGRFEGPSGPTKGLPKITWTLKHPEKWMQAPPELMP